ncbi:MAG: homoserine kinase [Balneola sp.]
MNEISVFAPATVANVACGFDVLGFALNDIGDELTVRKTDSLGLKIAAIHGGHTLSLENNENVVTVAVQALLDSLDEKPSFGFEFELTKKVKPGSGLGSSASSSAAAVFAVNELLDKPYSKTQLVKFAMEGEKLASGVPHADNVAPSLLGGFTLIRSYSPLDVVKLSYPKQLYAMVVHPQIEIKTSDAKRILKKEISLKDAITQWGNLAGLVSGLASGDFDLIGRSLHDVIAEPVRGILIPAFKEVKNLALENNALGCSISGSGPSIFALFQHLTDAESTSAKIKDFYKSLDVEANTYVSGINSIGAEILS